MAWDPTVPATNAALLSAPIRENFAALNGLAVGGVINPMTAAGDLIVGGTAGAPARLGIGTNGHVLTLAAGLPTWAAATGGGSVTYPLLAPDGTMAAPSYAFSASATTGVYYNAGAVVWSIGGSAMLSVGPGAVRMNTNDLLGWTNSYADQGVVDLTLYRDATSVLAQRNSSNALQKFRVYGDATNYTEITGVAGLTTTVVNGSGVAQIVALTQAAYDALTPKVATTLYVING